MYDQVLVVCQTLSNIQGADSQSGLSVVSLIFVKLFFVG